MNLKRPGCILRVLLAASGDLFPLNKTLPSKTCIRTREGDERIVDPTPIYNGTLRSECCSLMSLKLLQSRFSESSAYKDACMLGAIWLRQRGFGSSIIRGGFGQFEWSSMISLLMRMGGLGGRPLVSTGYNSHQLVKATLQILSTTDLVADPMILQPNGYKHVKTDRPVLFDGARGLNILYKMSAWSYKRVSFASSRPARVSAQSSVDPARSAHLAQNACLSYRRPFHGFIHQQG